MKRKPRLTRRELAALGKKVTIEYRHRGASCPRCGYIFDKGFTNVTKVLPHPEAKAVATFDAEVTICTRCGRLLVVEEHQLREATEAELALLTEEQRQNVEFVRMLADLAMERFS